MQTPRYGRRAGTRCFHHEPDRSRISNSKRILRGEYRLRDSPEDSTSMGKRPGKSKITGASGENKIKQCSFRQESRNSISEKDSRQKLPNGQSRTDRSSADTTHAPHSGTTTIHSTQTVDFAELVLHMSTQRDVRHKGRRVGNLGSTIILQECADRIQTRGEATPETEVATTHQIQSA